MRRLHDDPTALEEIYTTFGPTVLGYLARRMPRADAEDVLQQTFLEVWQSRATIDPERRLEPFIMTIARRRTIDHFRRLARRPNDSLDSLSAEFEAMPDRLDDRVADSVTVRQALDTLPAEQRDTLELAYFAQLTQREIADVLGVPLGTVKARAARGLRRLTEILAGEGH
jgi:RNA polymerase sigma-70 factor (ECF subfamily)